jgi:hypothetical protein
MMIEDTTYVRFSTGGKENIAPKRKHSESDIPGLYQSKYHLYSNN